MDTTRYDVTVVGAGLAGSELSWQLAEAGLRVRLIEMKPAQRTPAQVGDDFAELVCSNSLRSQNPGNAVGLLKEEMCRLGSLVIAQAHTHRVPAGDALAVDRVAFSRAITEALHTHPNITVQPGELTALPRPEHGPHVLCTGPLTAPGLAQDLRRVTGADSLYFYDAIAPIVAGDSLAPGMTFAASRWDKGDGRDYLNCPLDRAQYEAVVHHLTTAACFPAHEFEKPRYFAGCQPMEVIAASGRDALRFGALKPVGLTDPKTGRWPHAVVQLRAEDKAHRAFNLVGLQTKMRHGAQRAFLELIPGLRGCEVLRYGAMHRNTYVDAPKVLDDQLRLHAAPHVRLAGQIVGVEGYVESAACGLILALAMLAEREQRSFALPEETALGALWHHVRGTHRLEGRDHEPQNVNWGMFPEVPWPGGKRDAGKAAQKMARIGRAVTALEAFAQRSGRTLGAPSPAAIAAVEGAPRPRASAAPASEGAPVPAT